MIRIAGIEIRYLQEAGADCKASCFEMRVAPGSRVPPPHSHDAHEELVYVLDGVLRYTVDGIERDLKPGESMGTPCGSVHAFSNPHAEPARALVFNTPGISADYFREVAAIASRPGPPDVVSLASIMKKHGLKPAAAH